jgi:hypothetical protein
MATGTCCPVNAQNTVDEIVAELLAFRASSVIIAAHHENRVALENALARSRLRVVLLHPDPKTAGVFTLQACAVAGLCIIEPRVQVLISSAG